MSKNAPTTKAFRFSALLSVRVLCASVATTLKRAKRLRLCNT